MEIKYYKKNVYGNEHLYIASTGQSEVKLAVQQLTGTKTLLTGHIEALEALGFTFKQVLPE